MTVAESLLGTPYLWGGNSRFGLDCSGLVQLSMHCCGKPCPGDSDMQMSLGRLLSANEPMKRGDASANLLMVGIDTPREGATVTSPVLGASSPAMRFSTVVLPQPDGPHTHTN